MAREFGLLQRSKWEAIWIATAKVQQANEESASHHNDLVHDGIIMGNGEKYEFLCTALPIGRCGNLSPRHQMRTISDALKPMTMSALTIATSRMKA